MINSKFKTIVTSGGGAYNEDKKEFGYSGDLKLIITFFFLN